MHWHCAKFPKRYSCALVGAIKECQTRGTQLVKSNAGSPTKPMDKVMRFNLLPSIVFLTSFVVIVGIVRRHRLVYWQLDLRATQLDIAVRTCVRDMS
jgi:hypothetical protein